MVAYLEHLHNFRAVLCVINSLVFCIWLASFLALRLTIVSLDYKTSTFLQPTIMFVVTVITCCNVSFHG